MNTLFLASLTLFHYANAPFVEMREQPTTSSELNSQAYYSEKVNILEEGPEWTKIDTAIDNFSTYSGCAGGWVKSDQICHRRTPFPLNPNKVVKVNRLKAHLYHTKDTVYGPIMTLPFESVLEVIDPKDDGVSRWINVAMVDGKEGFIQRGDITFNLSPIPFDQLPAFSQQFLGLPYTWAGRSSYGYDCSGFTQMLYRQAGIFLPRDSKPQMDWEGFKAITIEELKPGDLIFFGYDKDRIRHVAMYIGNDQFIHPTVQENAPYLRISKVSDPFYSGQGVWPYRTARTLK